MNATQINSLLNRLRITHTRSLIAYLGYAGPWIRMEFHAARDVLKTISTEINRTADRLGEMILSQNGEIVAGEFSIDFAGLHDLSLDYLLGIIIQHQEDDIAAIQDCVTQLNADPLAQALAEEALGAAKGHLDSLLELVAAQSDA